MVENIVGEVEKAASVSNRASNIPLYALSAIALFAALVALACLAGTYRKYAVSSHIYSDK
ncbi:MAG: hypothetical protein GY707_19525 [Desulfobacteraceae bacterium]|nr:hypothetical protein [Desulfobacteraceae bacterium]